MKSILSDAPFTFKYSGTRTFEFDPQTPVLATDSEARIIVERFGSHVIITDMEPDVIVDAPVETPAPTEPVVTPPADAPLPVPPPMDAPVAPEPVLPTDAPAA